MNKKAMVAMSGGVDSSVAALLVRQMGCEAVGVTLRLYSNEDAGLSDGSFSTGRTCCSLDDVNDARAVCSRLGIPFYVFDFREEFRRQVMERFVAAYERGETPNPCIDCNRYIKFARLLQRAKETGFDYVATGHYARVARDGETGRWLLKKGLDTSKDQSYVLYSLTQEELSHLLLPMGELTKAQAREIAEENGFVNAKKRDSQDICFVPDGDYAGFIERSTGKPSQPGAFVGTHGEVYGEHKGIVHYTVGQRKGLGLSFPQPMYVCGVDPEENRVILGRHEELFSQTLTAGDINLISRAEIGEPMRVKAKIRYRQPEQPATVVQTGQDQLKITFDEPQRAVTKGQAVVLYDGDTVVGGGTITGGT